MIMFMDIKTLSEYLNIKTSTLYAWVSRKRIPYIKIGGLIRFRKEEIDPWVESFRKSSEKINVTHQNSDSREIDSLIESAKREAYNRNRGETRPKSALRKENRDGAV